MAPITVNEQNAFGAMQARLIELLLRHDNERFRQFYDQRTDYASDSRDDPALNRAREYGVLFYLRDELFEHILPRIIRRLSFESPRTTIIEEPPARGRVNWARTLDATWNERPGETPLELHTHQRRRDFATPENMLTIVTLLEYRNDVQALLETEPTTMLSHPLQEIVERCERELAFPQFAGLRTQAHEWLEQHNDASQLEDAVQARLVRGGNSAYEELLRWRERRRELRLLHRDQATDTSVFGADPANDNRLYELWIFYELVELLQAKNALIALDSTSSKRHIQFRWGNADQCVYELRHNQHIPEPFIRWKNQPRVRPDFYVRRLDPAPSQVRDGDGLYWREPGMLWDAKYYREQDTERTPSPPVKRMIADLTLLGEPEGILLFGFLRGNETANITVKVETPFDQTLGSTPLITSIQLKPGTSQRQALQRTLSNVLDRTHARLKTPVVPRCEGVFLDAASSSSAAYTTRYGDELNNVGTILVCPKRHIGAWRVDLVDRDKHCLREARVCHIIHQPMAQKPIRPVRTAQELLQELNVLFQNTDDLSDEAIATIAQRVEHLTRQFATLSGKYQLDSYLLRLRDLGMQETLKLLQPSQQESLALGIFLVDQLDAIQANDYSAPAIHLSSVMEIQLKKTVYTCKYLIGDLTNHKKQTLGTLPFIKLNPHKADGNWEIIQQFAAQHWHAEYHDDYPSVQFGQFIDKALNRIAQIRNNAAHTTTVPRTEYEELQKLLVQGGKLGNGAFNILLLAWQ